MKEKLSIFKLKEHLDQEYIKLVKNKNYNKIDKDLMKILKNILEETIIIIEKNKLNKYIEEFEHVKNKIFIYINQLKFNENITINIKLKIPWLKKKAEKEYLENLKSNFDLLEIKNDLIEMFSLIELTIYHIEDLNIFYNKYNLELEKLIKQLKFILKETETEKNKLNKNNKDIIYFDWLEVDLNNMIAHFIETRITLNNFVRRMDNLKNTLVYFNNRFKDVFKQIISLRAKLIKWKLKNNIAINEYKQIYSKLKKINKKKKD